MEFVGLYDYNSQISDELSFKKGERLEVIKIPSQNWWWAKSLSTNKEGYIPRNYVIQESDT